LESLLSTERGDKNKHAEQEREQRKFLLAHLKGAAMVVRGAARRLCSVCNTCGGVLAQKFAGSLPRLIGKCTYVLLRCICAIIVLIHG